jgi:hypothetical protein
MEPMGMKVDCINYVPGCISEPRKRREGPRKDGRQREALLYARRGSQADED